MTDTLTRPRPRRSLPIAGSPTRRSTILTLARHEYRAAIRSRSLLILLAILVTATVASVYVGAVDYASQLADYEAYLAAATANGVTQIAPSPLALLSLLRGAMEYIEIIGAVIAITLGYLSVAREQQSRTLPLIRSRPVTSTQHTVGVALGLVLVITTLVAVTAAAAILSLGLVAGDWVAGTQILKLLLAYPASIVYLSAFAFLGAIMTARSRAPLNGFMVALAIWVVVVLVIPQIGDTLDADNQIPGGLFASLGLGKSGEDQILAHFSGYERIRTTIEATSFSKHFERFVFAMTDIKPRDRGLPLAELLNLKRIELIWMSLYTLGLSAWLRRALGRQPTLPQGGPR